MKRLLIALLLLAAPAWAEEPVQLARMNPAVLGAGGSVAPSCVTPAQECGSGTTAGANVNWFYLASPFIASESVTICSVDVTLKKVGTPEGTHKAGIYTNNAAGCSGVDCPGTLVGSWSDDYNNSDLSIDYAVLNRTKAAGGLEASVTADEKYWLVMYSSLGSFNAAPYPLGDLACGNTVQQSDNGNTWTSAAVYSLKFQFYK